MIKAAPRRWRGWWTLGGTLPVVAYGAWLRSIGLDPPSLWIDDVWVGALCKAPLLSLLAHGSSSPPLFDLMVALCVAVFPDPELSAQLFPFVCSLLAIVAVAWATLQVTRNPACATFAAALYACDPMAVIYATRVKQYSSDALVSAIELGLVCLLLRRPTRRLLWGTAIVMTVGMFLSTLSLFVVAGLLPVALLSLWRREAVGEASLSRRHLCGAGALVFAVGLALSLSLAPNPTLLSWWSDHYLPVHSPGEFFEALWKGVAHWPAKALHDLPQQPLAPGLPPFAPPPVPGGTWIGLGLVLAGAISLGWPCSRRRAGGCGQRPLLLGMAAVPLLVLVASAMGRFPLEGATLEGAPRLGRIELFLSPLVACLMAAGLLLTARLRQPRWRKLGPLLGLALAVVQLPLPRTRTYIDQLASPLIKRMEESVEPKDSVWTNVLGSYWLAYYGPWSVSLEPDTRAATGFHAQLAAPGFRVFDEDDLDALAAPSSPRIHVFLAHTQDLLAPRLRAHLSTRGYARCSEENVPGAMLLVFLRDPG